MEKDSTEDVDENDDDDDEEEEEEEEEVEKPRKRARKAPSAQSRRRASATKSNGVSKASKAKKPRKPRNRDAGDVEENPNECPMLGKTLRESSKFVEALLDDKVALDATILEWIERYEEDKATAMTEMVNFILRVISH